MAKKTPTQLYLTRKELAMRLANLETNQSFRKPSEEQFRAIKRQNPRGRFERIAMEIQRLFLDHK